MCLILADNNKRSSELLQLPDSICLSPCNKVENLLMSQETMETVSAEAFWLSFLIFRSYQEHLLTFPKKNSKFDALKATIENLDSDNWLPVHNQALLTIATDFDLILVAKDAIDLIDIKAKKELKNFLFVFHNLSTDLKAQTLIGIFQLVQSCDAKGLTSVQFKIELSGRVWKSLTFDNKSHVKKDAPE